MPKDYLEPEDLLTDETFLSWYFGPGREADRFWNGWAEGDQARKVVLEQAVALLEMTRLREKGRTGEEIEAAADVLMSRIDEAGGGTGAREPGVAAIRGMRTRRWVAAACVLVVLTGGMMAARMWWNKPVQIATAFGEVNLRTLPDGSEVTMNANSRLRLSSNWQEGRDREVWIEGEAFFHVQKTPQRSRFIVHTNRLDIIVTGTQFNVVNRDGKENVMLREGSVIVHPVAGELGNGDLAMVPGDFVKWNGKGLEKGSIKSDSLLAWKRHQLLFENTPLKDVVGIIKDQYGVRIELEDQSIADSTISGIMRNDNLDVFLQALETTSDFQVIRKDGKIAIKASKKP
ncbi:MAG TPA: FecR domain-containing protein [Puia sp.]|nr:FecR domain-containing protein [Puia sp.]